MARAEAIDKPGRSASAGKAKLLTTAIRLFAEEGFDAVSTKRLAVAAGVTIGALYHHFPSKNSIYRAAVETAFATLPEAPRELTEMGGDTRDQAFELVAWFSATIAARSHAAMLFRREMLEPHLNVPISDIAAFSKPLAQFRALMKELAPQADADLAVAAIAALTFGLTNLRGLPIRPSLATSLQDSNILARTVTDIVLRGL